MKYTVVSTILPILGAFPVIEAYAPGSCGHAVIKEPAPQGFRCGNNVAPTGQYATRAQLGPPIEDVLVTDCYDACDTTSDCRAAAFTSSDQEDSTGICQLYSRGAGAGRMKVTPSPNTIFFNKACLTRLDCFNLRVNDPSGTFQDNLVFYNAGLNPPRLSTTFFQQDDGSTNFYTTSASGRSDLINDKTGLPAQQNTDDTNDYVIFPDGLTDANALVSCQNGSDNSISCSTDNRNSFFICFGTTQGLYLTDARPNTSCLPVTLFKAGSS